MKQATLCFLIKEQENQVKEICLALKKRGFGKDRWNGFGGKVKEGESIEQAMERETEEEGKVDIKSFYKVAELTFFFPHNPDWDQQVHTYFCKDWIGEPQETEEMKPQWFLVSEIPFDLMWQDDIYWLPKVIDKKLIKGTFSFDKKDKIVDQEIKIVDYL